MKNTNPFGHKKINKFFELVTRGLMGSNCIIPLKLRKIWNREHQFCLSLRTIRTIDYIYINIITPLFEYINLDINIYLRKIKIFLYLLRLRVLIVLRVLSTNSSTYDSFCSFMGYNATILLDTPIYGGNKNE